jgi:LmbE family N-acetylglucosaminyl deacetylase
MAGALQLMAVFAHPDDESLGTGGTLAYYSASGVETHLVTATRGERGRFFDNDNRPSDEEVGRVREQELRAAAAELGVRSVTVLDYLDGELDRADPAEAQRRIVRELRAKRPHAVLTFAHDGAYGHPDHIAISQLTTAATLLAADPSCDTGQPPHRVAKLYWLVNPPELWELYQRVFKRLVARVDGVEREAMPWPHWMITARIDTRDAADRAWRAIRRHETQLAIYAGLEELTGAAHERLWGTQHFYRVYSTVNGGRARETDLFEGLR